MSQTDSFIDEVSEELRRDQLFALFRKYGWIAGVAIALIVGGAAYFEWRQASEASAAQAQGDAILSALEADDPAARAAALGELSGDADLVTSLLQANALVEAGDTLGAASIFDQVADQADADIRYTDLARFKALLLRSEELPAVELSALFGELAAPGRPYRVLAAEQAGIALINAGQVEEGLAALNALLSEAGLPANMAGRLQQVIIANGGRIGSDPQ